jgi:hypothetical protein
MQSEDNTPELRARLRPTVVLNRRAKLEHDFRNRLTDLAFAVATQDRSLSDFYLQECTKLYSAALTSGPLK